MTNRRGWKTPGSHSWEDLNPATLKTCSRPRDMLPRMEIRVWVPRWWPRWISLVFSSTSGKGYSCPARDVENAYLFITNVLTSDAHVVLRPWSMTDSVISLQKPNQSVLGDFLSIRLISLLRVYKSCWRLMRSTGAKSFPAAVASSFPAADALFSALATWWEAPGVEISLSYIMHDERFFE